MTENQKNSAGKPREIEYLPLFMYGRAMFGQDDYSEFIDLKEDNDKTCSGTLSSRSIYLAHSKRIGSKDSEELPVLVEDHSPYHVEGELYWIKDHDQYHDLLKVLDKRYEVAWIHTDSANGLVHQKRVKVDVTLDDGSKVEAWTYEVVNPHSIALIESEAMYLDNHDWSQYLQMKMDLMADDDWECMNEEGIVGGPWDMDEDDDDIWKVDGVMKFNNWQPESATPHKHYTAIQPAHKAASTTSKFYVKPGTDDSIYIWYVAYGSNLNVERFLRYLNVGRYSDKDKFTADDIESVQVQIPHGIYFAKSGRWGSGGIAFLDVDSVEEFTCAARAYRLTTEQFWSVVSQENGSKSMTIPWNELMHQRTAQTKESGLYSRIANLGSINGEVVLTCTNPQSYAEQLAAMKTPLPWQYLDMGMINPPSNEYLNTINAGAEQTQALTEVEVTPFVAAERPNNVVEFKSA